MPEFKAFELAIQYLREVLLWRLRNPDIPFKKAPGFDPNTLPQSYLKKLIQ